MIGLRVLLGHPQLPSCQDCQTWLYDLKTGRRTEKGGAPAPRPPGTVTPCHVCPKIPAGMAPVPANAVELSERNWRAYQHYLECRAVNWQVPEAGDPIVRRNAAMILAARELVEKQEQIAHLQAIANKGRP